MIRSIVTLCLQFRYLVCVVAIAIVGASIMQLGDIPIDIYPEINPPLVEVQTESLGLSAAEMEALITVPLEADLLNGVAWLDQMYSETVSGLSSILLVFEPGTDPISARQMVQERLTQTYALPNVSKPPTMLQPLSSSARVMMIGLSSDTLSSVELGVIAHWNIKPRLIGVSGVANVAIWGARERQLQVQVDPKTLHAKGVTLGQVVKTVGEALWYSPLTFLESSTPGTAGWIDTPNQRLGVRHELPISSPDELAQVAVDGAGGLRLMDTATVVEDHQPLIGDATVGGGRGLLLVIEKFPEASTLEVTNAVDQLLTAMQPGLTGVEIDTTIFRSADYIQLAIRNIGWALVVGAALLIIVLVGFFRSWRQVIVSLAAIALSLFAAVFVLHVQAVPFNIFIVAGLAMAVGSIVGDSIFDVYSITRVLESRKKFRKNSIIQSIVEVSGMRSPLIYATAIIILTVIPVFFLEDVSGALFQPFATSYILAVSVSLVVAITVTPVVSLLLLPVTTHQIRESPFARWIYLGYEKILTRIIRSPGYLKNKVVLLLVFGLLLVPFMTLQLLPEIQERHVLVAWKGAPGTSRSEMNRILASASHEITTITGVKNVGFHVGRAVTGDQVVSVNSAQLWVSLHPTASFEKTRDAVRDVVDGYPGLARLVSTYQPERINDIVIRKNNDIVVRVYGHDMSVLKGLAQEVSKAVLNITGVNKALVEQEIEEPQVEIEVDLAAGQRYQIKPGDVRRQTATLLSGLGVGNLYEDQKVFDVVVWGVPAIRNSPTDIETLLIETPVGHVPLAQLADVRVRPAPAVIKRDGVSRFMDVIVTPNGGDIHSIYSAVKELLANSNFPLEYHAEVLSVPEKHQPVATHMIVVFLAVVLGIILIMQAELTRWSLALATAAVVPVALLGGLVAIFADGGVVSIGSLLGCVTIIGITVRNSLVMVKHLQQARVFRDLKERFMPQLASTLGIAAVFLPFSVLRNAAGYEILHPMAVVILGGLATSVLVSFILVPTVYIRFGQRFSKEDII